MKRIFRPDRAGSAGAGHHQRRGGQPHLPRLRGRPARASPGLGKMFELMAEEEVRHRPPPERPLQAEVRRLPAADPAPGRQRLQPPSRSGWCARSASPRCANMPPRWSTRPRASIARRRRPAAGLVTAIADRSGRSRRQARKASPTGSANACSHPRGARQRRRDRAAHVRVAIRAPGLVGLMDGSVSTLAPLFAAAFATPPHLGRHVPGRRGRLGRRRHFHGDSCRSAVRRRFAQRGAAAWLRGAVCGLMTAIGWPPPYSALSDPRLPDRDHRLDHGGREWNSDAISFLIRYRYAGYTVPRHHLPDRGRRAP